MSAGAPRSDGLQQRFVFDRVADLYDRARPGYPDELVEDVVNAGPLRAGSRLLEIGCGTGQATASFARRGFRIVALEPGPRLAALARRNLARFTDVEVVESTFEDFALEPDSFDLVYSGQALHWVSPDVRFAKSARALRPGGHLAFFGWLPRTDASPLREALDRAYAACAPELAARQPLGPAACGPPLAEQCAASACFVALQTRGYPRAFTYSSAQYAELLQTQSDHQLLPPERLATLLAAVRDVITRAGGRIEVDFVCRLVLAKRCGAVHAPR